MVSIHVFRSVTNKEKEIFDFLTILEIKRYFTPHERALKQYYVNVSCLNNCDENNINVTWKLRLVE